MQRISKADLIRKYKIISDQVEVNELTVVLDELEKALMREGSIVEFGCYIGSTSLYIQRILDLHADQRAFHVYDSFEGLPEKAQHDVSPLGVQFKEGELLASKKQFIQEFKKAKLKLPVIHKGWFSELEDTAIPETIAFAFLDGDYYDSIKDPLRLIEPHLVKGAILVVDDYSNQALPGAAIALDEWARSRGYRVLVKHSLGIIYT